jgi:phage replication-related protein YjqB (UPF0714/DUF867 family)
VLRSRVGFLALHGGLERGTAELATAAAEESGASLYRVVQPPDLRWHVPSSQFAPAESEALDAFLDHVEVAISLHGYGGLRTSDDRWTTVLVGGGNRPVACALAEQLRAALPSYTWLDELDRIPVHLRGVHPKNPVNRPRLGGAQLELPPRARGYGQFWSDWRGPGLPPHSTAIIATLADFAGMKLERDDIT